MTNSLDNKRARAFGRMIGRINQRLIRDIAERQILGGDISQTQKMALVLMKVEGNRISDLAKRMHVSKQAASKTVQELEAKGYVVRSEDPTDRRAFVIDFTPKAMEIVKHTLSYFEALEKKLKAKFGNDKFDEMIENITELANFMDPDGF